MIKLKYIAPPFRATRCLEIARILCKNITFCHLITRLATITVDKSIHKIHKYDVLSGSIIRFYRFSVNKTTQIVNHCQTVKNTICMCDIFQILFSKTILIEQKRIDFHNRCALITRYSLLTISKGSRTKVGLPRKGTSTMAVLLCRSILRILPSIPFIGPSTISILSPTI